MRLLISFAVAFSSNCFGAVAITQSVPMVVDAANRTIGYYAPGNPCAFGLPSIGVVSRTGYVGCITTLFGDIAGAVTPPGSPNFVGSELYFETLNCSGQELLCGDSGSAYVTGGFVIQSTRGLRMVAPGAFSGDTPTSVSSALFSTGGVCQAFSVLRYCVSAEIFEANVSGFSSVPYLPPLRISVLDESMVNDVIFFDGFSSGN